MIISLNGIERIGKGYYAGIINQFLRKECGDENIKKFSFPSYTTLNGKKLAKLIREFRGDLSLPSNIKYRRIADHLIENFNEYRFFIESHSHQENKIAVLNNNYFSVIAHGLASSLRYISIIKLIDKDFFLKKEDTLAFFLISKDVRTTLTQPLKSFELYSSERDLSPSLDLISDDYVNYFELINNYYKQIYITLLYQNKNIKPVMIEVDTSDVQHITKTLKEIKLYTRHYISHK